MPGNERVNVLHPVPRAEIPADEWDDVVQGSPDGWVFGLYGWQELILAVERWGLQDHRFALRENGRLVAVVPLQFSPTRSEERRVGIECVSECRFGWSLYL